MELPNWVVDEVLIAAKPTAFRLAVMLYRHGSPRVGADGERRVYWRGSLQQLARFAGASKRSVIDAERELTDAGLLAVHQATRPNSGHAISAPIDRRSGADFAPRSEAESLPHGDDQREPFSQDDPGITTTTPEEAEQILHRLTDLRVTNPAGWIARFGAERCDVALEILAANRRRGYEPRNPAGFLHTLLTSSQPLDRPPKYYPAAVVSTSLEARKEKYLGGAWGHLAKHQ